jgi:hypothetical protein
VLALQEADEGVFVTGDGFVELVGSYVLRGGDSQGEAVCLECNAPGAQVLEKGVGVYTSNLTMPFSSGAYKACGRAPVFGGYAPPPPSCGSFWGGGGVYPLGLHCTRARLGEDFGGGQDCELLG